MNVKDEKQTKRPRADEGREYLVFNVTDGILATPNLLTLAEAEAFVRDFPRGYKRRGYYLTRDQKRIAPNEVELRIVPASGFGEVQNAANERSTPLLKAKFYPRLEEDLEDIGPRMGHEPDELRRLAIEAVQTRHQEGFVRHPIELANTDDVLGRFTPTTYDLPVGSFTLHFSYEADGILIRGFSWQVTGKRRDERDGFWSYR